MQWDDWVRSTAKITVRGRGANGGLGKREEDGDYLATTTYELQKVAAPKSVKHKRINSTTIYFYLYIHRSSGKIANSTEPAVVLYKLNWSDLMI